MKFSPWIHTTDSCNMKCEYCYVSGNSIMEKPVYDAILKLLPKEETHIRIAGGEPLLVYSQWKDWCANWKLVEVLTNFRIIPDGYFNLSVRTSVSIDGYGDKILDKEMKKNLSKLKDPWIMTTLYKINELPSLALYIANNNYGWAISTDYFGKSKIEWEDLLLALHEVIQILKAKDYDFRHFNFNNLDFGGRRGCRAGDEMFSINTDGTIYTCQTCHSDSQYVLGNVWDGFKQKYCGIEYKECKECSIRGTCTGWCPLYFKPERGLCSIMKYVTQEVLYAK